MVVKVILLQPWFVVTFSICALFIIVMFVFYCICWGHKSSESPRFYTLDESGLKQGGMSEFAKNSLNNLSLFRRFSVGKEIKNEGIFTSKNLPFFKQEAGLKCGSEILDTTDNFKSFDNSVLEMENTSETSQKDDLCSCRSSDSMYTFYTMYPNLARTNSRATFVSVDFNGDTKNLINSLLHE